MTQRRPLGITLLSLFFLFGTCMSGLAATLLLFPGTALDVLWRLNPRAREEFISLGVASVVLLLVVSTACLSAAVGLWRRTRWGYRLALTILAINLTADTLNAFVLHDWRTLIGIPIAGLMITYLVRERRWFE